MRKFASALALCCASIAPPAVADIDDGLNEIRRKGCDRRPGVAQPLRSNRELDVVAREWSKGGRLHEAIARSDYRATESASMRVEGSTDPQAILEVLRKNYCQTITDPTFKEIGTYRRGDALWVVVAAPFVTPSVKDSAQVSQQALALVNAARAKPRKCGRSSFPAVAPLRLSAVLNRAALIHSQDMANKDFFEHRGSDGSKVSDRVTRVGYTWRTVGENIAIGSQTAEAVVQGWIASPGHCANIMSPGFTEMGIAFVADPKSDAGIYWTQVFATPR
ncbi:CAP domain-containing protein [Steroidobacter sp. S1-65]|uniref:CAP domain-containing protein n=1 Tax=Steroidobacter gossypii TaxID=2805490 RepID=A0ABS1WSE2_9GAMM|nr:CAP domain-containing protein [Steroidobacter gossypii]MBM0103902.1 CAP domain-containing protein [Steroidobacter gossypii]